MTESRISHFVFQSIIYYLVLASITAQCYRSRISYGYYNRFEIPTSTYKSYISPLQTINVDTKDDSKDQKNVLKEEIPNTPLLSIDDVSTHDVTSSPDEVSFMPISSDSTTDSVIDSSTSSNDINLNFQSSSVIDSSTSSNDINLNFQSSENTRNWNLVWRDDFDGEAGTLPSNENWIFDIGTSYPGGPANWGNREAQYYTDHPDNVCTDGKGNLMITPLRDEDGNWTSARIETKRTNFKAPKGGLLAIEGRIQMPNVTGDAAVGYWPAFWALGSPLRGHYYNWPQIGEFDIMENVNGLNSVWGVLHCGLAPNDPCKETNGLGKRHPCPGDSCQSAFHTYRFEWDESKEPTEMRWFVDGEQYHNVTADVIDGDSWTSMTSHNGYFILLNVAIGGAFPNALVNFQDTPTNLTESGHSMLIDYVAVYDSIN